MSLVGNLEDLSLGDILQIISLSQKSGVLSLKTGSGSGRIAFVSGLVRGAAIEGRPHDLRGLLIDGGFLDDATWSSVADKAAADGTSVGDALGASTDLSAERIDSLCRESVEASVVEMFTWQKGDFSFDVRLEPVEGDPELLLPMGVNAQYLAMEAARMRDETGPDDGFASPSADVTGEDPLETTNGTPATDTSAFDAMSAEEMFGVTGGGSDGETHQLEAAAVAEELPPVTGDDLITAADALARATLERVEAALGDDAPDFVGDMATPGPDDTQDLVISDIEMPEAGTEVVEAELIEFSEVDVMEPEPLMGEGDAVDPFAAHADAERAATEQALAGPGESGEEPEALEFEAVVSAEADTNPFSEADAATIDAAPQIEAIPEVEVASEPEAEASSGTEPAAQEAEASSGTEPAAREAEVPARTDWAALASRPVVVVDESLPALEWVKDNLRDRFEHVHIFQRSDQGLARIRQYLIRGAAPILILAPDVRVDHLSGLKNTRDFVERLKAQSRRIDAIWLVSEEAGAVDAAQRSGASLRRPSDSRMRSAVGSDELRAEGAALADRLGEILTVAAAESRAGAAPVASSVTLARLRDTTRQLGDASSGGEILPLVIRFASELFSRVAMFMVRDDVASGLGQVGLDRCGGPDDDAFRKVRIQVSATGWLKQVIETRGAVGGPPSDEGDRDLAGELGDRVPETAYCAPIESAGQVVALLYADNLPGSNPVGDTSALEVVLHHAGLALDRAALERALQEDLPADS